MLGGVGLRGAEGLGFGIFLLCAGVVCGGVMWFGHTAVGEEVERLRAL